jgi:pilus assembly protein CpaC
VKNPVRELKVQGGNMKVKKVASYIFALFIMAVFSSTALAAIPVNVTVGKGTILTLKEVSKRVSIADPGVADINLLSPTEILLNGKRPGATNLIVWDTTGKATFFDVIVKADLSAFEKKLKEIAPDADIIVETAGDTVILRGDLKNEQTKKKIEAVAKAYVPKLIDLLDVKEAQQVELQVRVAQIDKTKMKDLGISFLIKGTSAEGFSNMVGAPQGGSTVTTSGGATTITSGQGTGIAGNVPALGTYNPLDAFQAGVSYFPSGVGAVLKLLVSNGFARILASPNLVVRSGQSGKFLVGQKVPVQTVTGVGGAQTPSITYEQVGVKLNFNPEVLETGTIRLKIDPAEVSNIIGFLQFSGGISAPEIDTRQVSTDVDLKEGESLILAGLLSEETRKNIQKIPGLGDIPILGALFRSTHDEIKKTELVFLITPKLVKPVAEGTTVPLPTDNRPTPEEEREFQWVPTGQ